MLYITCSFKAHLHWQSLLAKPSVKAIHDRQDTDKIIFILCCAAQGGQGKYSSDCRVLLSLALSGSKHRHCKYCFRSDQEQKQHNSVTKFIPLFDLKTDLLRLYLIQNRKITLSVKMDSCRFIWGYSDGRVTKLGKNLPFGGLFKGLGKF